MDEMDVREKEYVYIQSYKHDGSLHRTWAKGFVIEANASRIVLVTNRALVSEADGSLVQRDLHDSQNRDSLLL